MDWDELDTTRLFETIRGEAAAADAEQMIWALEHVLAAARIDPSLLDHFAAAAICALAYRDRATPRQVIDQLSRRSVGDTRWKTEYGDLLPFST